MFCKRINIERLLLNKPTLKRMSDKEIKRRKIARAVYREAWKLLKQSVLFTLSTALKVSWKTVRSMLRLYHSKIRGVTYSDRQTLLKRLSRYHPNEILLYFQRERNNIHDSNAIQVIASVKNKGSAILGYVSREIAAYVAPMIDAGYQSIVIFNGITGRDTLGCNYSFLIIEKATQLG